MLLIGTITLLLIGSVILLLIGTYILLLLGTTILLLISSVILLLIYTNILLLIGTTILPLRWHPSIPVEGGVKDPEGEVVGAGALVVAADQHRGAQYAQQRAVDGCGFFLRVPFDLRFGVTLQGRYMYKNSAVDNVGLGHNTLPTGCLAQVV